MKRKLFFLLLICSFVSAKLYVPSSVASFDRKIHRHQLAVVHFNPFELDEENVPALQEMQDAFIKSAYHPHFKQADVAFIGVNMQQLPKLAQRYGLSLPLPIDSQIDQDEVEKIVERVDATALDPEDQATLMLFKDGKPLMKGNEFMKLEGFVGVQAIINFMQRYLGNVIKLRIQEIEQEQREQRQQAVQERTITRVTKPGQATAEQTRYVYRPVPAERERYVYHSQPYRYYGPRRPYWRRRYGGLYGPGFGFGVGFGRGWGWRRGGFGIGFGW